MTLAKIRDWLSTLSVAVNYYTNRLDNSKDKSLCVSYLNRREEPVMAIGGLSNSSYDRVGVSLLLHWNRSFPESELAASALWNAIFPVSNTSISEDCHVFYIQPLVPRPIYVDTDDNGVHEFIIEFLIYYRRYNST